MTPNADKGGHSDWWQRFAKATVEGTCIPCPDCDHRHDCWICEAAGRFGCVSPNGSSVTP